MDILTMGFAVCDVIVKPVTPEFFQRDSTPVDIEVMPGGDACNVAINAAALGMETGLISAVGKDLNGQLICQYLKDHHVNTSGVAVKEAVSTATSLVMVQPDGERHFLTSTDIFQEIHPNQVTRELLKDAKILSINSLYRLQSLDEGGAVPVFKLAHEMGVVTAADTAWNRQGRWMERIEPTLHYTDIFLPSYQEAAELTGETDIHAMRDVMRRFGIKIFGVKLGSKGSYVTDFKDEVIVKPFQVKNVVSTVGAGDSYMAGFLTAQIKGMDLYESAVFASAVAAFTVQTSGAVGGVPAFEDVEKFVAKNRYQIES